MPMIDVYAGAGVFDDTKELARSLAAAVMAVDGGWRLWGHAHMNTELVQAARSALAQSVETSTAAEA